MKFQMKMKAIEKLQKMMLTKMQEIKVLKWLKCNKTMVKTKWNKVMDQQLNTFNCIHKIKIGLERLSPILQTSMKDYGIRKSIIKMKLFCRRWFQLWVAKTDISIQIRLPRSDSIIYLLSSLKRLVQLSQVKKGIKTYNNPKWEEN
jgi:hypothetical protein